VSPFVGLPAPHEISDIEGIFQNRVQVAPVDLNPELSADALSQFTQRYISGRVGFVDALYHPAFRRIYEYRSIGFVVLVADRSSAWVHTCFGLGVHSLDYLFPKIVTVKPCRNDLDTLHELGLGFGILGNDVPVLAADDSVWWL
jgi:hypothetical protein